MKQYSVNTNRCLVQQEEYQAVLSSLSETELLKEFFSYLDYTEESDSGTVFHPVSIGSSRVMIGEALADLLKEMRSRG